MKLINTSMKTISLMRLALFTKLTAGLKELSAIQFQYAKIALPDLLDAGHNQMQKFMESVNSVQLQEFKP